MKKVLIFSLVLGVTLLAGGIVVAAGVEKGENKNPRYLVKSNNSILKMVYGVNHKFDSGFTTDLTRGQLKFLDKLGVETEILPVYHIQVRPYKNNKKPVPDVTCEPSQPMPEGVAKVNGGTGGAGTVVAVLDTGVYREHSDLKDNVIDCKDMTKRGIREGCVDTIGHGTHVAGTILANGGDGTGIIGVAPEAKLMAIKVCGRFGCQVDDIATGIRYATDNGANIISMSLSGDTESSLIRDAIGYAVSEGVLVIAAAGNDGPAEGSIDYPGANPNVMAIGAIYYKEYSETFNWTSCIDEMPGDEAVACWSSRGINDDDYIVEKREIELAAPGVFVESTFKDGCYESMSGTSMATPHVAGLAAKLWQGDATSTRISLQDIAKNIWSAGDDTATGFGLPVAP